MELQLAVGAFSVTALQREQHVSLYTKQFTLSAAYAEDVRPLKVEYALSTSQKYFNISLPSS